MSGQSEQYSATRPRFDPIGCVGILLLCFVLLAGVRGLLSSFQRVDRNTPTPFVVAVSESNLLTLTPIATAMVETLAPTATETPPPEFFRADDEPAVTVIRMTATPSETAPPPTETPTATPTATPLPPDPTDTPTPFVIFVKSPTPIPDELVPNILTLLPPTPTPLPTPTGPDYGLGVPILMYHYTSEPPEDADKYRTDLSVSPANLRRQLEYLQANGYTTIDFYELARGLANRQTLPEKPVILTFDDGYRDNYEHAFPLLQAFGMKGVFFIITEPINFNDPRYVSWEMVREMADAGMSMEIHTVSHPNLADLDDEKAQQQIVGAQEEIAAHTGYLPRFLSYPGGDYDDETIQIARDAELWGAVTTRYGTYHQRANRYEWRRVRMRYTTSIQEFAALLKVYVPEE